MFIHSFIHIEHLNSASARKLLRGIPNSSTVTKSSLKVRIKRRWQGSIKKTKFRREAVPGRGAQHGECAVLLSGGTGNRDKEKTLLRWAEQLRAHSTRERTTELTQVDRSKAK